MQGTHGTADDGAKGLIQMDEPPMHAHAQVQHLVLGDAPKGIHTAFVGEIDPVASALEIGNAFLDVPKPGFIEFPLDVFPMQIGTQGIILVLFLEQPPHLERQGHICMYFLIFSFFYFFYFFNF